MIEAGRKILLIDEKLDTTLYITLREEGHAVIACESSKKAWHLIYPFRPHFILIHLPNPSRTDIALLQECRAMARGVPIVVATSQPGQDGIMKFLEHRVTSFLSLPVTPHAVRRLLDDLEPSTDDT